MRGRIGTLAGAAVLALVVSGCFFSSQTTGWGDQTRTWKWGKLSKTYRADFEQVWNAASAAVHNMQLKVNSEHHDALIGQIRAYRSDDISVRLDLENIGKSQTRVIIWVGAIGRERDRQCATVVMDAIDKNLGR